MKPSAALPYWWMLLGAFCFSWMGILTHALRETLAWQTIALVRTGLALVIAAALTWHAGARFAVFRPATLWMRSLSGSMSLVLTFYALTHARSLAEVLVLTNMFPIWVALLSWPVLGVWPRWDSWVAIAFGMAGVVLINNPQTAGFDAALGAAALSSLTTAAAMLGLHRLHHLDPRAVVTHFSAVSVLFCLGAAWLMPLEGNYGLPLDGATLLLLLGVGVSATAGQLFLTKAFAAGPPARISVVGLSQVAFTAVADGVFWHRSLQGSTIAGMLLIVLPTAWLLLRGESAAVELLPDKELLPPPME